MTIKLADAATVAAADAITALVDAGVGDGVLKIFSGAQAADPDGGLPTGLLITIPYGATAYAAAAVVGNNAVAQENALDTGVTATGAGTAASFVVEDSAGVVVFTGTVTDTGSGGDLELDNTSIAVGQEVQISDFPFTVRRDA